MRGKTLVMLKALLDSVVGAEAKVTVAQKSVEDVLRDEFKDRKTFWGKWQSK